MKNDDDDDNGGERYCDETIVGMFFVSVSSESLKMNLVYINYASTSRIYKH